MSNQDTLISIADLFLAAPTRLGGSVVWYSNLFMWGVFSQWSSK